MKQAFSPTLMNEWAALLIWGMALYHIPQDSDWFSELMRLWLHCVALLIVQWV